MLRVLDLSRLLPGPYCTRILADFGFEVIKLERPGEGDWVRGIPPFKDGVSALFQTLNGGKKSLTLDLKSEPGREVFLKFVETVDVLLESFRPGVMSKLGLSYERLSQTNPRLVYCSLTGFGDRGPYRDRPGHDLNYIGLSGLLHLTGSRDGPPAIPGTQIADLGGALWAVIGIQQCLWERERTGKGGRVDSSLLGAAISMLPVALARQIAGEPMAPGASDLTGGWVCYQVYATKDGKYMTLGALEPKFWMNFCLAVGREDLVGEQFTPAVEGQPAYDQLCALFRSRTQEEWVAALAGEDACCEPLHTLAEALESEPVRALEMLREQRLLPPVHFSTQGYTLSGHAPALGEHTRLLLAELGYTADQISAMQARGVI
jgi:crotonobetainyl-CoA:carnitine CoA-transferase CaiB-like acyl-CoA transferase